MINQCIGQLSLISGIVKKAHLVHVDLIKGNIRVNSLTSAPFGGKIVQKRSNLNFKWCCLFFFFSDMVNPSCLLIFQTC